MHSVVIERPKRRARGAVQRGRLKAAPKQPTTKRSKGVVLVPARRLEEMAEQIRICVKCPLHESRTNAVPGEGKPNAKVMIIGEAPGKQEDEEGRPFVGNAGRYLEHVLEGSGFNREDFFITNTVKCRPPANRKPKAGEVDTCTHLYLFKQMELLQPKLVMLLGSVAVSAVLGMKSVEEARGKVLERDGRKYIVSYHPAVRFYREDLAVKVKEDFELLKKELGKIGR